MRNTLIALIFLTACGLDGQTATSEAQAYARELGFTNAHVTCQDFDSDGDGYVSCTVVDRTTHEREAVECSGFATWNSGCRLATGRARRTTQQ